MKKTIAFILSALALSACSAFSAGDSSAQAAKTELSICTLNILIDGKTSGPNRDGSCVWKFRRPVVKEFIAKHDFDILCCQEPLSNQVLDVAADNGYEVYFKPVRTTTPKSPCNPVYYKKSRFELLDKGEFYFSKTPEVESNDWDSPRSRCATWVKLRDKKTRAEFFVFSLHFTHIGKVAKFESAKVLVKKVAEITKGAPFFAMGDFNSFPDSPQIKYICSSGVMRDSKAASLSEPVGEGPSFHGVRKDDNSKERIDYIFVSPNAEVLSYCLDKQKYGDIPLSDHYPVRIKARF